MQHGILFSILIVGITIHRGSRRGILETFSGMGIVTVLVLLPIVLWGAVGPMLTEVIVVPLSVSDSGGILHVLRKLRLGFLHLGYTSILVIIGAYGLLRTSVSNFDNYWWVLLGGILTAGQVMFIDFDSYPDLFFVLIFMSLGVAFLINTVEVQTGKAITAIVMVIVAISILTLGGVGVVSNPVHEDVEGSVLHSSVEYAQSLAGISDQNDPVSKSVSSRLEQHPYGPSTMEWIYWEKVKPKTCHYRLSMTELRWVKQTNQSLSVKDCSTITDNPVDNYLAYLTIDSVVHG